MVHQIAGTNAVNVSVLKIVHPIIKPDVADVGALEVALEVALVAHALNHIGIQAISSKQIFQATHCVTRALAST
jgi:hypothetical protein